MADDQPLRRRPHRHDTGAGVSGEGYFNHPLRVVEPTAAECRAVARKYLDGALAELEEDNLDAGHVAMWLTGARIFLREPRCDASLEVLPCWCQKPVGHDGPHACECGVTFA